MRLKALQLERYGLFANQTLQFNSSTDGRADLHIVYGDNEAGKTTALAAWLDFLFGIKRKTRYGFRHGRSMQVGACLEDDGTEITLLRSRGATNTLKRNDGTIESDSRLASHMGGLDRTQYELIYSVNDETLEKGGEEIVNSRGDLGRLLFSASAGIAEVSSRLAALEKECNAFHRTRARNTRLNAIKAELGELADRKKGIEVTADAYARIAATARTAATALAEAQQQRDDNLRKLHDVDNRLKALSTVNHLAANRRLQEEIGPLPPPPRNWRHRWEEVRTSHQEAKAICGQLEAEIKSLEEDHAGLAVDDRALQLGDDHERLEQARSAYVGAMRDLPKRTAERELHEEEIQHLLGRVGLAGQDVESLLADAHALTGLRNLINASAGIRDSVATCQDEHDRAVERCEENKARLGEGALDRFQVAQLESLLERIERQDPRLEKKAEGARLQKIEARIAEVLTRLTPWSGTIEDLDRLSVPPAGRHAEWRRTLAQLQSQCDATAGKIADTSAALDQAEAVLSGTETRQPVSCQDLAALRRRREEAWSDHRIALDAGTADAFESVLREHDELIHRYVNDQRQEIDLGEKHRQRDELKAMLATHRTRHDELVAETKAMEHAVISALGPLVPGLTARDAIEVIPDWLTTREQVLEAWHEAASLRDRLAALDEDIAGLRNDLDRCLEEAGLTNRDSLPLETLITLARNLLKDAARNAEIREQVDRATRDLGRRKAALTAAVERHRAWQAQWQRACQDVVFGQDVPGVEVMAERLDGVQEIERRAAKKRDLDHRTAAMHRDVAGFETDIRAIAVTLGVDASQPLEAWRTISRAIRTAKDHARDRTRIEAALAERRSALQDAATRLAQTGEVIATLGAPYNLTEIGAIEQTLDQAERRQELMEAARELTSSLGEILSTDDVAAAEMALRETVRSDLEARRTALAQQQETLATLCDERLREHDRCHRELTTVSGDDDVARLESRIANLELGLEEEAIDHLRQRLGILAVENAIRKYMQTHRSDMMEKASEVFRMITGGAYSSLATEFQEATECLTVTGADGTVKRADSLSKGTRFQLYLALRIAGIHETLKSSPALPFIADDVLETFDDQRAAQTLKALESLAKSTQVIYFTHHRHLCTIARATCPQATIQELQAP